MAAIPVEMDIAELARKGVDDDLNLPPKPVWNIKGNVNLPPKPVARSWCTCLQLKLQDTQCPSPHPCRGVHARCHSIQSIVRVAMLLVGEKEPPVCSCALYNAELAILLSSFPGPPERPKGLAD